MNEKSNLGKIIEGFVLFLILLVTVETLFELYVNFADFSARIRKYTLIAGFCFDIIFSIEFLSRLSVSSRRKGLGTYIGNEGGVVDFFSSLPLLALHSGPLVAAGFFSTGRFGLSGYFHLPGLGETARIVMVAGALRFLRPLKIYGKIHTRHLMTPVYTARAVYLAAAVAVAALMGFSFFGEGTVIRPKSRTAEKMLANYLSGGGTPDFKKLLNGVDGVLFVEKDAETVYSTLTKRSFQDNFFDGDYFRAPVMGYEMYLDNRDVKKTWAFIDMLVYSIVLGTMLFLSTAYRSFFARHVTRVVQVMVKGFASADYLTPVRIVGRKKSFETYRLADQYNRKWLPVKRRILEIRKKNFENAQNGTIF